MITFKSIADVNRLLGHPVYAPLHTTIEKLVAPVIAATPGYRPEDDGRSRHGHSPVPTALAGPHAPPVSALLLQLKIFSQDEETFEH